MGGADRAVDSTAGRPSAPTIDQRILGERLRSLREQSGLTLVEAAERLVWSPTRVQEMEAGMRRPSAEDLHNLGARFKLDDRTAAELAELTRKAQQQGWWADYEDLRVPYIGLEEHASAITAYTTHYFPALLQTGDYARAIIAGVAPEIDPRILQQRVEARLRRQRVLNRENPLHYRVLLDESVLDRPVGGPTVMQGQLDKVLALAQDAKAIVQVIPLRAGANAALDSNFVLLDFPEPGPSAIVYVEGLVVSHYLDRKEEVDRYREAIGYLLGSALSPQDSVQHITQVRNNYGSG